MSQSEIIKLALVWFHIFTSSYIHYFRLHRKPNTSRSKSFYRGTDVAGQAPPASVRRHPLGSNSNCRRMRVYVLASIQLVHRPQSAAIFVRRAPCSDEGRRRCSLLSSAAAAAAAAAVASDGAAAAGLYAQPVCKYRRDGGTVGRT